MGHVRRQRGHDAQRQQPPGQSRDGQPVPAAYSTTIEEAYTSPSIVAGSSRAVTPLSPCARTTS
jgi:hypothetical protein